MDLGSREVWGLASRKGVVNSQGRFQAASNLGDVPTFRELV